MSVTPPKPDALTEVFAKDRVVIGTSTYCRCPGARSTTGTAASAPSWPEPCPMQTPTRQRESTACSSRILATFPSFTRRGRRRDGRPS